MTSLLEFSLEKRAKNYSDSAFIISRFSFWFSLSKSFQTNAAGWYGSLMPSRNMAHGLFPRQFQKLLKRSGYFVWIVLFLICQMDSSTFKKYIYWTQFYLMRIHFLLNKIKFSFFYCIIKIVCFTTCKAS